MGLVWALKGMRRRIRGGGRWISLLAEEVEWFDHGWGGRWSVMFVPADK
jgi:hypothetical protein